MAKKYFEYPYVLLTRGPVNPDPGDGGDSGYGSGQSGVPYACSYEEWMSVFHVEMDGVDGLSREDYRLWWIEKDLDPIQWEKFNGTPLKP